MINEQSSSGKRQPLMKKARPISKQKALTGFQPVIKRSFLNAVRLERELVSDLNEYPFALPAIRHLHRLEFHPAVTFFIGENGSGKSTLLEAIAVKLGYHVTKDFLNCHERMLEMLLTAEDD